MIYLKQSTAATIKLGPFVDATDGVTAETGLTIQKADVRLSKNGGNMAAAAADQGESDAGAAHDELGYYDISLGTGDTDTVGRLKVMVSESGALPVWAEYEVVPANVFDSIVAGTDKLDTNAAELGGTLQSGRDIGASVLLSPGTGTGQISLSSGAVTAGTVSDKTGYGLTSAYDAAKTAAQAGDEMDLVDAPNGTAVTAIQSGLSTHSAADAATAVWAAGTRTLTSFGTLAADAAAAVWAIATSTLTSAGTIGKLLVDKMGQLLGTIAAGTHNAQSGDAYGVVTNATYGNSAIKTLVDALPAASDIKTALEAAGSHLALIKAKTDNLTILDKLDTAMEADGAVYKFTANALEEAPAGGTGDAPSVEEIEAYLASKHGAGTWGGAAGEGPNYKELRYYADEAKSIPIRSVRVTLHTDAACETPHVYGPQYSDVFGTTKWHLDAGTYYVLSQHADYTFTIVEITVP